MAKKIKKLEESLKKIKESFDKVERDDFYYSEFEYLFESKCKDCVEEVFKDSYDNITEYDIFENLEEGKSADEVITELVEECEHCGNHGDECHGEHCKKDLKDKIEEEDELNEGTSNFGHLDNFPLLVFYTIDEVYDMMRYDDDYPKREDFEDENNMVDEDAYYDAVETFEQKYWDELDCCALDEDEVERLEDKLAQFNSKTKDIADRRYGNDVSDDYFDNLNNLDDIELVIEPGYYSAAYINVKNEDSLNYMTEDFKREQIERINDFMRELEEEFGLSEYEVAWGPASNGETGYRKVKKESLKEDKEDSLEKMLSDDKYSLEDCMDKYLNAYEDTDVMHYDAVEKTAHDLEKDGDKEQAERLLKLLDENPGVTYFDYYKEEPIIDKEWIKVRLGEPLKESDKQAPKSIEDCQKWIDYDMEHYGKISDNTNNIIKKAGFQIIKDDHGDYEVTAGEYENLNESDEDDLEDLYDLVVSVLDDYGILYGDIVDNGDKINIVGVDEEEWPEVVDAIKAELHLDVIVPEEGHEELDDELVIIKECKEELEEKKKDKKVHMTIGGDPSKSAKMLNHMLDTGSAPTGPVALGEDDEVAREEYCVMLDGNNVDCYDAEEDAIKYARRISQYEENKDKNVRVLLVKYGPKDENGDEPELGVETIWAVRFDEALKEDREKKIKIITKDGKEVFIDTAYGSGYQVCSIDGFGNYNPWQRMIVDDSDGEHSFVKGYETLDFETKEDAIDFIKKQYGEDIEIVESCGNKE